MCSLPFICQPLIAFSATTRGSPLKVKHNGCKGYENWFIYTVRTHCLSDLSQTGRKNNSSHQIYLSNFYLISTWPQYNFFFRYYNNRSLCLSKNFSYWTKMRNINGTTTKKSKWVKPRLQHFLCFLSIFKANFSENLVTIASIFPLYMALLD